MNVGHFPPPKRRGLVVHGAIILVLTIVAVIAFINLSRADVGPAFLISLLVGLFTFAPIPLFVYRAYSLLRADYYMDRDSLAINWGLRVENIPLTDIEWIRSINDLTRPLVLPALSLPGGLLGVRRHPDLGVVEFLASDPNKTQPNCCWSPQQSASSSSRRKIRARSARPLRVPRNWEALRPSRRDRSIRPSS